MIAGFWGISDFFGQSFPRCFASCRIRDCRFSEVPCASGNSGHSWSFIGCATSAFFMRISTACCGCLLTSNGVSAIQLLDCGVHFEYWIRLFSIDPFPSSSWFPHGWSQSWDACALEIRACSWSSRYADYSFWGSWPKDLIVYLLICTFLCQSVNVSTIPHSQSISSSYLPHSTSPHDSTH